MAFSPHYERARPSKLISWEYDENIGEFSTKVREPKIYYLSENPALYENAVKIQLRKSYFIEHSKSLSIVELTASKVIDTVDAHLQNIYMEK